MFDKKNFGISIEKRNIFFYLHHRVIMEKWHTLQLKVKKELNGSNDKNQCLYVLYQNELITLLTDTTIYIKCRCCRFGSILVVVSELTEILLIRHI